ncbi:MAG: PQQ-binding-like beta-propeller repeat protein, partial [Candidatus Hydrogenedentes bacterium]|nr:PQQ-binding-like beta-propeller repeat protein [Candidatus Hydrogenedentota bacterium]
GGSGNSACPMLIADLNGDWQWNVVVGLANGTIAVVDAAAGSVLHEEAVASKPAIGIACGELLENAGQEILVATDERLYCLSAALETLWEIPMELSGTPAVSGAGTDARILAPTRHGALVCLDGSGDERWRDERAAAAIAGHPLIVAASNGDQEVCIFGSEDGLIRAIILPE